MKNKSLFCNTLQTLTEDLTAFQSLVEIANKALTHCHCTTQMPVANILNVIPKLLVIINEFNKVKSLTLLEQDYINFCLLLSYGNDMADFLLKFKNSPEKSRAHARSWKNIAINFVPFLKDNLKEINS